MPMQVEQLNRIDVISERLESAYGALKVRLAEAENARCAMESAREDRVRAEQVALVGTDPKNLGANEAQRKAQLAVITSAELTKEQSAIKVYERSRFGLEMARTEVEYVRAQLRLMECECGIAQVGSR